jgi:predicted nucleotidyltransferase
LDLLCGVFSNYPALDRAIVYGSRAKGNYRNGSDIDITLDGSALTYDDLLRIETALDDLMLPWGIDLSLLSHIDNPALLDHITRIGKALWVRESAHSETAR